MRLAVLGTGNLGGALVRGWCAAGALTAGEIRLVNPTRSKAEALAAETGARVCTSAAEALDGAEAALVAVKPHLVASVLTEAAPSLAPDCLIVSVAAGVRTTTLEALLAPGQPVVRVLPNTAVQIGAGAAALCRGTSATDAQVAAVQSLFDTVGCCVEVTEAQLDGALGVAASGIAFVYLFIEALIDGGVRAGLPRAAARTLALQTALGAAQMVRETGEHPARLKDAVTTPGGTTMAGLDVLESQAVRGAVIQAVDAAARRSRELG